MALGGLYFWPSTVRVSWRVHVINIKSSGQNRGLPTAAASHQAGDEGTVSCLGVHLLLSPAAPPQSRAVLHDNVTIGESTQPEQTQGPQKHLIWPEQAIIQG